MSVTDWSLTAAANADADANINWQEGQPAASVNNSARAVMAALRAAWNGLCGSHSSIGGSANAITIASNQAMASLVSNVVGFFAVYTNSGAVTLNVDGLGAKGLRTASGTDLVAGQIVVGRYYQAIYDVTNDKWILLGAREAPGLATYFASNDILLGVPGVTLDWSRDDAPPTGWVYCAGQELSRTTESILFAKIGTKYGAGNGSTTFNVRDMRGRAAFGRDNMGGSAAGRLTSATITGGANTSGNVGGAQTHTITLAESADHGHAVFDTGHTHPVNDPTHPHNLPHSSGAGPGWSLISGQAPVLGATQTGGASTGITIGLNGTGISILNAGGGGAHNNMPPAMISDFIMCTGRYA